jgi:Holliday junction resolvase-like predicted endonuclease
MTVKDVFELRRQGLVEEAYNAARSLYALDKDAYTASAMFWTAVDMLKLRANEDNTDEARKIYFALNRLLNGIEDENGWMHEAMEKCSTLLEKGENRKGLSGNGPEHMQMGIWGEEKAVDYLCRKGYTILDRDWHSKHRDIDIIARDGECIVFVEVKTRRNKDFCDPTRSINYRKRTNLRNSIIHYLSYRKINNPYRFDIITVVGSLGCDNPEIRHIENFSILR